MPDHAHAHRHPVNTVSVAQHAADILCDRADACALYDRLMRGPQRVALAEALTMIVTGDPGAAKAGTGRLREAVIRGALDMARERLVDRFGAPPVAVAVDWETLRQEVRA